MLVYLILQIHGDLRSVMTKPVLSKQIAYVSPDREQARQEYNRLKIQEFTNSRLQYVYYSFIEWDTVTQEDKVIIQGTVPSEQVQTPELSVDDYFEAPNLPPFELAHAI